MECAMAAVKTKTMNFKTASNVFKVLKTTLSESVRVKNKVATGATKVR